MEIFKKLFKSKKIFNCFALLWVIFYLLFFIAPLYEPVLSCDSPPGPFFAATRFDYRIAEYLTSIIDKKYIGDTLFYIWLILSGFLIVIGFSLKGIFRVFAIIAIIWGLMTFLALSGFGSSRSGAADALRMAHLSQIRTVLEIYYSEDGKYPGDTGSNQYDTLTSLLRDLPRDPCYGQNPEWNYEYWVSSDGQKYVLKANLQRHSPGLNSDLDGNILGASCGENGPQEREYCTSFYFE